LEAEQPVLLWQIDFRKLIKFWFWKLAEIQIPYKSIPMMTQRLANFPQTDYGYRTIPQKSSCLSLIPYQQSKKCICGLNEFATRLYF